MNFIDSVQIFGFWGDRKIDVKFNRDFNFIIGTNGSGKTTIINLIAAALRADIPTLYSIPFERIIVTLKSQGANRKPIIEVSKSTNDLMGSIEVSYIIKEKTTDKGNVYGVEGPYDERVYRDPRSVRSKRLVEAGAKLSAVLNSIIEVNWLSVHRGAVDRNSRYGRDEEFDSTVDQKISEISRKFSSYFSLLASKASEESKLFQEQVFLSLLESQQNRVFEMLSESDDPEERQSVIGVLGSRLIDRQSQNKTVAARATAERKTFGHLS